MPYPVQLIVTVLLQLLIKSHDASSRIRVSCLARITVESLGSSSPKPCP